MEIFLLILISIILLYIISSYLIGQFGSQKLVFGLNIKNNLKNKGFNVYNVNKKIWLDLGSEAFNTYNRLLHSIKKINEPNEFYVYIALRDYNVNSETPNNTIQIRVIEKYAELINEILIEQPVMNDDFEFIIKIFERNNDKIENLLIK